MISLDPLTIVLGTVLWLAFRRQSGTKFGVLTPERDEVYRNALEHLQDAKRLRALAVEFEKEGLKVQANILRRRADWRDRSPDLRAKHDIIFARAMKSENALAILDVAKAFESMTATVKAGQLRERAEKLREEALSPKPAPEEPVAKPAGRKRKDVNGIAPVITSTTEAKSDTAEESS